MNPILASGLTLIEVLFSLMVLSLTLLGLEAMELTAWHSNLNAYYLSQVEQQIDNLQEILRFFAGSGKADQQIQLWEQETRLILPQAAIKLSGEYPFYHLRLTWGEVHKGSCEIKREEHSGCVQEEIKG